MIKIKSLSFSLRLSSDQMISCLYFIDHIDDISLDCFSYCLNSAENFLKSLKHRAISTRFLGNNWVLEENLLVQYEILNITEARNLAEWTYKRVYFS